MNNFGEICQRVLELKSKADNGESWSPIERNYIVDGLHDKDLNIRILMASSVIVANDGVLYNESLSMILGALGNQRLGRFVELSLQEALVYLPKRVLKTNNQRVVTHLKNSSERHEINADNAIYVLARLARSGERQALDLLEDFASRSNLDYSTDLRKLINQLKADS